MDNVKTIRGSVILEIEDGKSGGKKAKFAKLVDPVDNMVGLFNLDYFEVKVVPFTPELKIKTIKHILKAYDDEQALIKLKDLNLLKL